MKNYEALHRGLTALTILIKASEETKDFAMAVDLKQVLDKVPKFDSKIEDCIKALDKYIWAHLGTYFFKLLNFLPRIPVTGSPKT